MIISRLHHLEWDHPFMSSYVALGLVPRFYQLVKTKLGLSISPFLVIDDNLFYKDIMIKSFGFMLLAQAFYHL
jgi:hypothetical protein